MKSILTITLFLISVLGYCQSYKSAYFKDYELCERDLYNQLRNCVNIDNTPPVKSLKIFPNKKFEILMHNNEVITVTWDENDITRPTDSNHFGYKLLNNNNLDILVILSLDYNIIKIYATMILDDGNLRVIVMNPAY